MDDARTIEGGVSVQDKVVKIRNDLPDYSQELYGVDLRKVPPLNDSEIKKLRQAREGLIPFSLERRD
ncbi:MAG: hypothetical protein JWO43_637 [Candidatus Adlerbacteria bacterium]|nr:hypothetical protein [Candidatus Adlerbacteria bacterium]